MRNGLLMFKGNKSVNIVEGTDFCKGEYVLTFYYNDERDYEWKRGAGGMCTTICKTLDQAKATARRYLERQ